jgi:dipeptidyl aminopeptidase/acylaminoacyl peptidase
MTTVNTPYGSWPSPISAARVAAQGLRLGGVAVDGDDLYWLEGRPAEGGRSVLVRRSGGGGVRDVVPAGFNVRTRVHEYGGGAFLVCDGVAYVSSFADGRLYRVPPGGAPEAITPEGPWWYADAAADRRRRRLIAVREDRDASLREPRNAIVALPMDGRGTPEVLVSGHDFYATPRLGPDGTRLCWLCWNHPHMPWDATELRAADVEEDGRLARERLVAGGRAESIYQPGWAPDGTLYYVADRSGWWQLYRAEDVRAPHSPVLDTPPPGAEFGRPQWTFGTATWAFADTHLMVVSYTRRGRWHLGTIDTRARTLRTLPIDLEPQDWLAATPTHAVAVAATSRSPDAVVLIDLRTAAVDVVRQAAGAPVDPDVISTGEPFTFAGSGGAETHAFYYAPRHPSASPPPGDRPPLIAIGHGGPTSAARAAFDIRVQFWTSRGFAVVDVNYGGSSGFGRAYRERLNGRWGIVDVDDMTAAARHLVEHGKADPRRLIARGGSAGGYTTLAALAFRPGVFTAGASYYGVSDLEALANDTHKFESRYLETLVGPWPAARDEYRRRSPIHALDRLSSPIIFLQGLEDRVVPPEQSARMADAVRRKGLPVAYVTFAGEQHGFRRAESIAASLEAELYFYGAIFGFTPADRLPGIAIDNL